MVEVIPPFRIFMAEEGQEWLNTRSILALQAVAMSTETTGMSGAGLGLSKRSDRLSFGGKPNSPPPYNENVRESGLSLSVLNLLLRRK